MSRLNAFVPRLSRRAQLGLGAAALVIAGAAGGAGAVSLTRPSIEMAPTVPTAIAKLSDARGVVTVKGRVAEVYGDRFVLQDATGRTMIDAGRAARDAVRPGTAMTVQGRYDDGQMRASYLVDPQGEVAAVGPAGGPRGPRDRDGPGGPGRPGDPRRDGPPPPPPGGPVDPAARLIGAGAPPPPPGCAAPPVGRVDIPPPTAGEGAAPPPQPMNGPGQPAVQ